MKNIVLLGLPFLGKGIQSQKLIDKYDFTHFSIGDLLRAEKNAGTKLGFQIKKYLDYGKLIPEDLLSEVLENKIVTKSQGFIFDSFPRTLVQAKILDEILSKYNLYISKCLFLYADTNFLMNKLVNADKSTREMIDKYHQKLEDVLKYYRLQYKFIQIDTSKNTEETFIKICKILDNQD